MNIIKYLILNNMKVDPYVAYAALIGGSEDVVQYFSSSCGVSFDNSVQWPIFFHNNQIAKWVFENYDNPRHSALTDSIQYFNTEMFLYFYKEIGININDTSIFGSNSLHHAAIQNNIVLIKYLLENGIDKSKKDAEAHTPYDLAITDEARSLLS